MKFSRHALRSRLFSLSALFILSLSFLTLPGGSVYAQSSCDFTIASLNPRGVFQSQINSYAQNILNLRISAAAINPTVNSANLLQNSQVNFNTLYGAGQGVFFNLNSGQNFPPTGTATLPRAIFNPIGALGFYTFAGNLNSTQLQAVQNVYAQDLISRNNYGVNVANLARNFTNLQNAGANPIITGFALNALRNAYNTLSNQTAPAPNPRQIYRQVAIAYVEFLRSRFSLTFNDPATITQAQLESDVAEVANNAFFVNNSSLGGVPLITGLNILGIGLSNYDTNRLPVPNGNNTPIATPAPQGAFPFVAFDTARNQPLAQAQANPDQVFGAQVSALAQRFGRGSSSPRFYQVNSANQIQAVFMPGTFTDDSLIFLFKGGVIPSATATPAASVPEYALTSASAIDFANTSFNPLSRQAAVAAFYNNPANATRRNNYITNLRNINCALTRIQQLGGLSFSQSINVQNALDAVTGALQTLTAGNTPDVLGVYKYVSDAADSLTQFPLSNTTQNGFSLTLAGSLLPIGLINYYLVPITLAGIS